MRKHLISFLLGLLCLQSYLSAQDKINIKFGKVQPADFSLSGDRIDSGANALIIADIGSVHFEGNSKGFFTMIFKRTRRVKIINRNGFDVAKVEIPLYHEGTSEERLDQLNASTFNLENGQVVETRLDAKTLFVDKINKNRVIEKFTFPGVKEGSIIDLEYTIKSDYFTRLRAWDFQDEYPTLWSEYNVSIPSFFQYVVLSQGDGKFAEASSNLSRATYNVRFKSNGTQNDEVGSISINEVVARWVKKDVPAIRKEPFITSLENYIARIEFQLQYIQYGENSPRENFMTNWFVASDKLLQDPNFGLGLSYDNRWLTDDLKSVVAGARTDLEKAEKIYDYVRDHFNCTGSQGLYLPNPLKTVFTNRSGNPSEINMLLTAMLRHEKLDANPVILSTRANGYPMINYPLIDRFNYMICSAAINGQTLLLDASRPLLGFNRLPIECYNGVARTINKENPVIVNLFADSLKESRITSVMFVYDENGKLSGNLQASFGPFQSYHLRQLINQQSESGYFKRIQAEAGPEFTISNTGIDSLNLLEEPIKLYYDFDLKESGADIIYFNPMIADRLQENPLKSAVRYFPVEMEYQSDYVYTLNMDIPKGYEIEEMPKSAKAVLNGNDGFFEYMIQKAGNSIQMMSRIKINRCVFGPEEYNTLRDFYALIVKKEAEQIVFKKSPK